MYDPNSTRRGRGWREASGAQLKKHHVELEDKGSFVARVEEARPMPLLSEYETDLLILCAQLT